MWGRLVWWVRWNLRGRPRWTEADVRAARARAAEIAEWLRDGQDDNP